ncbi:glutaredoxin domain-containing cysteine-rich protein 2 [Melozone crissalis]|uniref:glutaredoxin domain-containing cysteine-rich protein 2 n=1 Tax=Melozone crissalis TaxID=40204 RepID=UPI0023DB80B1|nr:glutaredoxin domain-containing cysteine-rich protein 2 [Melozone crissalis]
MEEPQQQQPEEERPRRVRFRISSAGSGRLLKQVYEDGQELEPPAEERSRRFLRHSFEPEEPLCGPGELPGSAESLCWPTALTARRISVLRESQHQGLLGSAGLLRDCRPGSGLCEASPVVDFGKIIIYTNNLKIIRAPMDEKELMRRMIQTEGINDWTFVYREKKERLGGGHKADVENMVTCNQHVLEGYAEHCCSQCRGSGCAPCSLCHGSKFSMLANRFRESYRALRCPACDESGLQPCWVCAA